MRGVRVGYGEVLPSAAYGAAAEHLAAAELLLRGHEVAWPAVDVGYDLLVDASVRVQVKAAGRRLLEVHGHEYERFCWTGVGAKRWDGHGLPARLVDQSCIDVFVLFGIEGDGGRRWWVVPAVVLAGVASSLNFLPGSRRGISPIVASYEDAWQVFDEGFVVPQVSIGELGGPDGGRGVEGGFGG